MPANDEVLNFDDTTTDASTTSQSAGTPKRPRFKHNVYSISKLVNELAEEFDTFSVGWGSIVVVPVRDVEKALIMPIYAAKKVVRDGKNIACYRLDVIGLQEDVMITGAKVFEAKMPRKE